MTASTHLSEVLAPLVADAGYDLEELRVSAAGKRSIVRVVVDKDGGVTLNDVADISRVISAALDVEDDADPTLFGTSYVLEVSSPGVDRPLTEVRHWRRNAGRLVRVTLHDGSTVDGRITSADDAGVVLDVAGTPRELAHADIAKGLVQVEFTRPATAGEDDDPDDDLAQDDDQQDELDDDQEDDA